MALLAGLLLFQCSGGRPHRASIGSFGLKFQYEDFVVPDNETWRLTWISPYTHGQIVPAYDVRIVGGELSNRTRA
jgi:hypothetical protein